MCRNQTLSPPKSPRENRELNSLSNTFIQRVPHSLSSASEYRLCHDYWNVTIKGVNGQCEGMFRTKHCPVHQEVFPAPRRYHSPLVDRCLSLIEFPPDVFIWILLQAACMANVLVALETSSLNSLSIIIHIIPSIFFLSNKKV